MLQANRKNYLKAYRKHFFTYCNSDKGCDTSRRMILCYCVECGLKCLIMKNNRINSVLQAEEEIRHVLSSHDVRNLLNAVNQAGNYRFKDFKTEYGDNVTPKDFHQFCRYSIAAEKKEFHQVIEYENKLMEIAEWLKEKV